MADKRDVRVCILVLELLLVFGVWSSVSWGADKPIACIGDLLVFFRHPEPPNPKHQRVVSFFKQTPLGRGLIEILRESEPDFSYQAVNAEVTAESCLDAANFFSPRLRWAIEAGNTPELGIVREFLRRRYGSAAEFKLQNLERQLAHPDVPEYGYQVEVIQLLEANRTSEYQLLPFGPPEAPLSSLRLTREQRSIHVVGEPSAKIEQFAFDVMVDRKVLTEQQAQFYAAGTHDIEPSRISYVRIVDSKAGPGEQTVTLLRNVSGQIVTPNMEGKITVEKRALPWMKEFPQLAATIDRSKWPLAFEWGRAATSVPGKGLIGENATLLALLTEREVVAAGGDPAKTLVFAHTTKPANAALYERKYGFKRLPDEGTLPKGYAILYRPLDELLRDFAPEKQLLGLGEKARVLNLPPSRLLTLMNELGRAHEHVLDLPGKEALPEGIALFDLSPLSELRREEILRRIPAPREAVQRAMKELLDAKPTRLPGETPGRAGVGPRAELSWSHPPDSAGELQKRITSLAAYYLRQYRQVGMAEAEKLFARTQFFISVRSKEIDLYQAAGFSRDPRRPPGIFPRTRMRVSGSTILGVLRTTKEAPVLPVEDVHQALVRARHPFPLEAH